MSSVIRRKPAARIGAAEREGESVNSDMTSPWVAVTTRRSGRNPAQISPLVETAFPLDDRSDFWESHGCQTHEIPGLCAGGTARPWRALLILGWYSFQNGDVE